MASPDQKPVGEVMSPQKGNLTGVPRKVRDRCAELHNTIQEWKKLLVTGSVEIREIREMTLELMAKNNKGTEEIESSAENDQDVNWQLQARCESLTAIYQSMVWLVDKMDKIAEEFKTLTKLNSATSAMISLSPGSIASMHVTSPVLFHSWTVEKFYEAARKVSEAYTDELLLSKRCVIDSIGKTKDKASFGFLMSGWIYDPHIPDSVSMELEAMLIETGHRYYL